METKKHGQSGHKNRTKEYRAGLSMKARCLNPNHTAFKHYGGRGIAIHPDWINHFDKFISSVGVAPSPKHTLDRIKNEEGYVPGNCKWSTRKEQVCNRRNNILVTHNGETKILSQWAEELGVEYSVMRYRYLQGWPNWKRYSHYNRTNHG